MKKKQNKNVQLYINKNAIFVILIFIATLFLSIGYAEISSIISEVNGIAIADLQSGIFITDVQLKSNVNANVSDSRIVNSYQTMLTSEISLSDRDLNSSITYEITVYNSEDYYQKFVETIVSDEFYNNKNITFEINELEINDLVANKSFKKFTITFKYSDEYKASRPQQPYNNKLESCIQFRFEKLEAVLIAGKRLNTQLKQTAEKSTTATYETVDETITRIIFDTWNDTYTSQKGFSWGDGIYVDEGNEGLIQLFYDSREDIAYILSVCEDVYFGKDASYAFYNLRTTQYIDGLENLNTSNVTDMQWMFADSYGILELNVSNFDTSNVTNMQFMFPSLRNITSLDVSRFDTSKVIDMQWMFATLQNLEEINLSSFRTSKVTSMAGMFSDCLKLKDINLETFDTSSVTDMWYMFNNCDGLTTLELGSFNTSNVTRMAYMFENCNSITSLDLSSFNTSRVTDMSLMFYNCTSLHTLDIRKFDISKANRNQMFYHDKIVNINAEQIVLPANCESLFEDFTSLESINISKADASRVTTMSHMFSGCTALKTLDMSNLNTPNLTELLYLCSGDINLTSVNLSGIDTRKVTEFSWMFSECEKLVDVNLDGFVVSGDVSIYGMFNAASALETVDLSSFESSSSIGHMFENATSIKMIDFSGFDFSSATSGWEYNRTFNNIPRNALIYVKDQRQKTLLESTFTTLTNIKVK